jgi:hypothetical protein
MDVQNWKNMKRIITLIAMCTALAPRAAHAQDDFLKRSRTCGHTNGRFWKDIATDLAQSAYLTGLVEMERHADIVVSGALGIKLPGIWPKGATVGKVREGVNQFYQDPANLQIAIIDAVSITKRRFEGKDPKTIIEESIRTARQWAIDCQQK